jgi:antitoxin (DNA-binding transcriptional repressor) of toxin-antitoxin stability system
VLDFSKPDHIKMIETDGQTDMQEREVQASEVSACLPQLLDDVERGVTVLIMRDSQRTARLVPETARRRQGDTVQAIGHFYKIIGCIFTTKCAFLSL